MTPTKYQHEKDSIVSARAQINKGSNIKPCSSILFILLNENNSKEESINQSAIEEKNEKSQIIYSST